MRPIPALLGALLLLAACAHAPIPPPGADRTSLMPLTETPSTGAGEVLVISYSGDGGWGSTDRRIAAALAARGASVVGISSLKYFWHERSPEEAARDLEAVIDRYSRRWERPQVILAGFSFGGAALPLIAPHLSAETRAKLRLVALIAPSRQGELKLRPWTWLEIPGRGALATRADIAGLEGLKTLCLYGAHDQLADCPELPVPAVRLADGHKFKGEADAVAEAILEAAR